MSTSIRFIDADGVADVVVIFDAVPVQGHSFKADVTDHAVEVGSNVADHVRPKPVEVRVEGLLTDFPLEVSGSRSGDNGLAKVTGAVGRSKADFEQLVKLHVNGSPVTLTTSLREYPNMVIQAIDVPRDRQTTRGQVKLSVLFKQITQVASATVPLQSAATRNAQSKQTKGKQTAAAPGPDVSTWQPKLQSTAFKVFVGQPTPKVPPMLQRPGDQ